MPLVVALDFDGVCIDSEPETSRVAWRTACELWPHLTDECSLTERVMDESAYVERRRLGGEPLCGTAEDAMPNWLRAKMRLLRPMMRDDADALLLVRLCMEEVMGADPRKRPLTVGEIGANWGEELRETLESRYQLSAATAEAACAASRQSWLDEGSEWEDAHGTFVAAMADLREASTPSLLSKPRLYILHTRADSRHVERLLKRHSVRLDSQQIIRCATTASCAAARSDGSADPADDASDKPQGKADVLAMLRERHTTALLRYVDDDADCLRAVASDPRLFPLQLFFAGWGYSTPEQTSLVAAMPRVAELSSSRELEAVLEMPRKDGTRLRIR